MENFIKFGSAGNPDAFYDAGHKSSLEMPGYLHSMGLNAYEYQCGRGVRISKDAAEKIGEQAVKYGIALSLHAPYFTNISSDEQERIDKTIDYIVQSAVAAKNMGATRVTVHMGAAKNMTRRDAMAISKTTIARALDTLDEMGLGSVTLCPETMGKINQMGTLEEVLELCATDDRLIPTIDFGHLNARTLGSLTSIEAFEDIIDKTEKKLGLFRASNFHSHFSVIEYTKGGEKKHLTFEEHNGFGPDYNLLAEVLVKRNLTPTMICESAGTQAKDAAAMMELYNISK